MKLLNRTTSVLGWIAAVLFVVWMVLFYVAPQLNFVGQSLGKFSNLFGLCATVAAFAAVGIWVSRKVYIEVKKRQIPDYDITRQTLLFLRKHHILLGWLAILAATSHGVYYLLRFPDRQDRIVTGLAAWVLLFLLAGLGAFLDYAIKEKRTSKPIRLYHMVLAGFFLVGLFVHIL